MKTRTALTAIFASLAAGLIGWQFAAVATVPSTQQSATGAPSTNQVAAPTSQGSSRLQDGVATGHIVDTRYGTVQVKITTTSGSISDVIAVKLTDQGGESVQISNYAAPILRSEVLQSQSARVSSVSGATYTSEAYLSSLQSALDQLTR